MSDIHNLSYLLISDSKLLYIMYLKKTILGYNNTSYINYLLFDINQCSLVIIHHVI